MRNPDPPGDEINVGEELPGDVPTSVADRINNDVNTITDEVLLDNVRLDSPSDEWTVHVEREGPLSVREKEDIEALVTNAHSEADRIKSDTTERGTFMVTLYYAQ